MSGVKYTAENLMYLRGVTRGRTIEPRKESAHFTLSATSSRTGSGSSSISFVAMNDSRV